jgi:hypothetical protein
VYEQAREEVVQLPRSYLEGLADQRGGVMQVRPLSPRAVDLCSLYCATPPLPTQSQAPAARPPSATTAPTPSHLVVLLHAWHARQPL